MNSIQKIIVLSFALFSFFLLHGQKGKITGVVSDPKLNETLIGATILIQNTTEGTSTDIDGTYSLELSAGKYNLVVSYVSYQQKVLQNIEVKPGVANILHIEMESASQQLGNVVVTVQKKMGTNLSVLSTVKNSHLVMNGISAQEISKTQDSDAASILRRIPGITIVRDRFIIVRGLSQRYNSVWLNHATTPSSEADSRSFSFDVIPSALIDNMMVYKSASAELPADFTGGFVKILTKNIPSAESYSVNFETGFNTQTVFSPLKLTTGSGWDGLGLGAGSRMLPSFPQNITSLSDAQKVEYTKNNGRFFALSSPSALPDFKAGFTTTQLMEAGEWKIGNVTSLNWSSSNQHYKGFYNIYNSYHLEKGSMLNNAYQDEVFANTVKLGALFNWMFIKEGHKLEFKNFFHQKGSQQLTEREGWEYYDGRHVRRWESLYNSRTTYCGQLAAEHTLVKDINKTDWTLGYAFANYLEPDRKNIEAVMYDDPSKSLPSFVNDGQRYDQILIDNSFSLAWNYEHKWDVHPLFQPVLKTGVYGEYKKRDFQARKFKYLLLGSGYNRDADWDYSHIFTPDNYRTERISLSEKTEKNDSYQADYLTAAAYISTQLNYGEKLTATIGLRVEYNQIHLSGYDNSAKPLALNRPQADIFPSINVAYRFNDQHQLRAGYGRAINRPEFRELAPYMYWNFGRNAFISGNPDLKNCYNDNVDLRYEYYPSASELISVGFFYKRFVNPIEESYIEAGSGLKYSYRNAQGAYSAGVEVEIKKSLDFITLKGLSLVLNGSYMLSQVSFAPTDYERDRPMAGQSPYMINAGLFYQNDQIGFSGSLLYNCFGKRLETVGIPKQDPNEDIPDMYEMPFHSMDMTLSQKIGKYVEIKFGAQNLLNSAVEYKQFLTIRQEGQAEGRVEQPVRSYQPGITFHLGVAVQL